MKSRFIPLAVAIIGLILAILLVLQLRRKPPTVAPMIEPARNPYQHTIAASGLIEAVHENIAVGVPEPGVVKEVHVKVWDKVQKDQPLLGLDDRDHQARMNIQRSAFKTAEAQLVRLQDQLGRLQAIKDPGAISQEELRTRENDVKVATAQLDSARAQLHQAEVMLDRLTIRAPRDGTILQCNIRKGEYASLSSKNPPILLGNLDQMQIRAQVDEQNAPMVPQGPATAYLKGNTTFTIPLHFVRIEPMVIPKESLTGASNERVDTRVLHVIYGFAPPANHKVYVGQQVDVFIQIQPAHGQP